MLTWSALGKWGRKNGHQTVARARLKKKKWKKKSEQRRIYVVESALLKALVMLPCNAGLQAEVAKRIVTAVRKPFFPIKCYPYAMRDCNKGLLNASSQLREENVFCRNSRRTNFVQQRSSWKKRYLSEDVVKWRSNSKKSIHASFHPFIHALGHCFIDLLILWIIDSLLHWFIESCVLLIHCFIDSFTKSLVHCCAESTIHSFIGSLIHQITVINWLVRCSVVIDSLIIDSLLIQSFIGSLVRC